MGNAPIQSFISELLTGNFVKVTAAYFYPSADETTSDEVRSEVSVLIPSEDVSVSDLLSKMLHAVQAAFLAVKFKCAGTEWVDKTPHHIGFSLLGFKNLPHPIVNRLAANMRALLQSPVPVVSSAMVSHNEVGFVGALSPEGNGNYCSYDCKIDDTIRDMLIDMIFTPVPLPVHSMLPYPAPTTAKPDAGPALACGILSVASEAGDHCYFMGSNVRIARVSDENIEGDYWLGNELYAGAAGITLETYFVERHDGTISHYAKTADAFTDESKLPQLVIAQQIATSLVDEGTRDAEEYPDLQPTPPTGRVLH